MKLKDKNGEEWDMAVLDPKIGKTQGGDISAELKSETEAAVFNFKGMERQNLHSSALLCLYHPPLTQDKELYSAARTYLINLFIAATNDLGKTF